MKDLARNVLSGKVIAVAKGATTAHVKIEIAAAPSSPLRSPTKPSTNSVSRSARRRAPWSRLPTSWSPSTDAASSRRRATWRIGRLSAGQADRAGGGACALASLDPKAWPFGFRATAARMAASTSRSSPLSRSTSPGPRGLAAEAENHPSRTGDPARDCSCRRSCASSA